MATLYAIKFGEEDYLVSRNINNVNLESIFSLENVSNIQVTKLNLLEIQEDEDNNIIVDGKILGYLDAKYPEYLISAQPPQEPDETPDDEQEEQGEEKGDNTATDEENSDGEK